MLSLSITYTLRTHVTQSQFPWAARTSTQRKRKEKKSHYHLSSDPSTSQLGHRGNYYEIDMNLIRHNPFIVQWMERKVKTSSTWITIKCSHISIQFLDFSILNCVQTHGELISVKRDMEYAAYQTWRPPISELKSYFWESYSSIYVQWILMIWYKGYKLVDRDTNDNKKQLFFDHWLVAWLIDKGMDGMDCVLWPTKSTGLLHLI